MYSCKIIKSDEVSDILLQVLPLRCLSNVNNTQFDEGEDTAAQEEGIDVRDEAVAQAEEILNKARAAADEVISQAKLDGEKIKQEALRQARLESEQIKQEAQRSAFDQGYRDGYREGTAKAQEEGEAIRRMAMDVLKQAEESRRRTLESLEGDIIDLAREIAEKLLSAQLSLDPESVFNVAVESLRLVADRLHVVIYISPAELALYEKRKDELLNILPAKAELQVITDDSIQPGGCRIETEHGRVDATVETRRKALLKALYGERGVIRGECPDRSVGMEVSLERSQIA